MAKKLITIPKQTIETMLNTAAITISTFGVLQILDKQYYGFLCVIFAAALEYFKYFGRIKKLW